MSRKLERMLEEDVEDMLYAYLADIKGREDRDNQLEGFAGVLLDIADALFNDSEYRDKYLKGAY